MNGKRRKELEERLCALAAELKYLGATETDLIALIQRDAAGVTDKANAAGVTDKADAAGN